MNIVLWNFSSPVSAKIYLEFTCSLLSFDMTRSANSTLKKLNFTFKFSMLLDNNFPLMCIVKIVEGV